VVAGRRRVVLFGGGTGLAVLIRALRRLSRAAPLELTAVVAVSDDGGSSGRLREAMPIPAVGDARACLEALCETPASDHQGRDDPAALLAHRHRHGPLRGHAAGNLLIAAGWERHGALVPALGELGRRVGAAGRVLPCTELPVRLLTRRGASGWQVGQARLARASGAVDDVALAPAAEACSEVLAAVREAQLILAGPGSLYSSVLASLLPSGLPEAVAASGARKLLLLNVAEQPGETGGCTAADEWAALHRVLGRPLFAEALADAARPVTGGAALGAHHAVLARPGDRLHDPALLAAALGGWIDGTINRREPVLDRARERSPSGRTDRADPRKFGICGAANTEFRAVTAQIGTAPVPK